MTIRPNDRVEYDGDEWVVADLTPSGKIAFLLRYDFSANTAKTQMVKTPVRVRVPIEQLTVITTGRK